jgi:hypothetical protein
MAVSVYVYKAVVSFWYCKTETVLSSKKYTEVVTLRK